MIHKARAERVSSQVNEWFLADGVALKQTISRTKA